MGYMIFNKGMSEGLDRWVKNGGVIYPERKIKHEVKNENATRNTGDKTHRQMAMLQRGLPNENEKRKQGIYTGIQV